MLIKRKERQERQERAEKAPGFVSYEPILLRDAKLIMQHELDQRSTGKVYSVADNHCSDRIAVVIILVTVAIEVWLNEIIYTLNVFDKISDIQLLWMTKPTYRKYDKLAKEFNLDVRQSGLEGDLNLLFNMRDDIVHFMPQNRDLDITREALNKKGLTIPNVIELTPYCYYKIGCFAFDTAYAAVSALTEAIRTRYGDKLPFSRGLLQSSGDFKLPSSLRY